MPHIFISYAREDQVLVERLSAQLKQAGPVGRLRTGENHPIIVDRRRRVGAPHLVIANIHDLPRIRPLAQNPHKPERRRTRGTP